MPAPLEHKTRVFDARIRCDDLAFLADYCPGHNIKVTEFIREAVHAAANAKRVTLGLRPT